MNRKNLPLYMIGSVLLLVIVIIGLNQGTLSNFQAGETVYLPIPELLKDSNADPNVADFEIKAQSGTSTFFDNKKTKTMGYNGNFLGPVIVVKKGEHVNMTVKNALNEATSVHWHGLKVSGENDGGPHQVIQPNAVWQPSFRINQPAATLWFHPHVMGSTASQVYYGLAGLLIIEDEVSESLDLPKTYGVNDLPLILQDRSFNQEGSFDYFTNMMDGAIGDTLLVNGAITPTLKVEPIKMRFRILNGANARNFNLNFDSGLEFYQIASDGGFLEKPVSLKNLFIAPGERSEIILDFSKFKEGQTVYMKSDGMTLMTFKISGTAKKTTALPNELTKIERMTPNVSTPIKRIELNGMGQMVTLNGKKFDMARIDDVAVVGKTELWEITSIDSMMHSMGHPFHIHGVQFQVLSRSSGPLSPSELGWKDTVFVSPNETVSILVNFEEKGVFMYHCHVLEHEEAGMMGQIEVR